MTPPLREAWVDVDEAVDVVPLLSSTLCRRHSPNEQPLSTNPEEPKRLSIVACLKLQVACCVELSTSPQSMFNVPVRVLIAPVRFVAGTPPQNVVFGRQIHSRSWQLQLLLSWSHESDLQ